MKRVGSLNDLNKSITTTIAKSDGLLKRLFRWILVSIALELDKLNDQAKITDGKVDALAQSVSSASGSTFFSLTTEPKTINNGGSDGKMVIVLPVQNLEAERVKSELRIEDLTTKTIYVYNIDSVLINGAGDVRIQVDSTDDVNTLFSGDILVTIGV